MTKLIDFRKHMLNIFKKGELVLQKHFWVVDLPVLHLDTNFKKGEVCIAKASRKITVYCLRC